MLGITAIAACWSFTTKEEIVKVAMAFVAVLAGFVTLCCVPWVIKVVIVAIPLLLDRMNAWSADV